MRGFRGDEQDPIDRDYARFQDLMDVESRSVLELRRRSRVTPGEEMPHRPKKKHRFRLAKAVALSGRPLKA